jgi:hypothetical protein
MPPISRAAGGVGIVVMPVLLRSRVHPGTYGGRPLRYRSAGGAGPAEGAAVDRHTRRPQVHGMTHRTVLPACLAGALAFGCAPGASPRAPELPPSQAAFWEALTSLCGHAYEGDLVERVPPDEAFGARPLVMHVRECEPDVIRIPFHIGENRSRTWVISRSPDGLRLKHDHRHEDGSPEELTWYGGDTAGAGTAQRQEFLADAETAAMLPAAATNVWTVEVRPGETFVYALRREGTERRLRVEFDLSDPVGPPPAPWGF